MKTTLRQRELAVVTYMAAYNVFVCEDWGEGTTRKMALKIAGEALRLRVKPPQTIKDCKAETVRWLLVAGVLR